MSRFVAVDREAAYLLPPSVDEWLPGDHLARFVVEVIDPLDLGELVRQYAGQGSDAHHPAVLLGLLIYGYASGVFSSRKIERATYDSVAFRYVAANTHPDHDTIATSWAHTNKIEAQLREEVQALLAMRRDSHRTRLRLRARMRWSKWPIGSRPQQDEHCMDCASKRWSRCLESSSKPWVGGRCPCAGWKKPMASGLW
jgi:Transposase domain (DUF772)